MSGLIPLGWTAQNRALGFGRQDLKGSVSLAKHQEQAKQQQPSHTTVDKRAFYCEMPLPKILLWPKQWQVFLIAPKGNFSTTPCHHGNVCVHMGISYQLVFSTHWHLPNCLWRKILLPWSKDYSVLMLQKCFHEGYVFLISLRRTRQQSKFKHT